MKLGGALCLNTLSTTRRKWSITLHMYAMHVKFLIMKAIYAKTVQMKNRSLVWLKKPIISVHTALN
ncbi:hypothetical protein [Alkalihalobacillus sp. TS-13]|uniref:hypothetical protein n=1 Tax=Alkalihalobacillus sp. TS-13 TaxID=2842455 RepID=UPI001C887EA2|nr:hypothetical protein [Alkalihalobacillus sp. TS-13]